MSVSRIDIKMEHVEQKKSYGTLTIKADDYNSNSPI